MKIRKRRGVLDFGVGLDILNFGEIDDVYLCMYICLSAKLGDGVVQVVKKVVGWELERSVRVFIA